MSPSEQAHLALVEEHDTVEDRSTTGQRAPMLSAGELGAALGLGTSLLVGRYSVDLASGRWWWSDEIYTMHGWRRNEVEPGLDALWSRKHPDDRARVLRAVSEALRAGRPFACAHRIVARTGRTRSVVVVGQGQRSVADASPEIVGYVLDATPAQKEALDRRSKALVDRAFVSQAVIEQAKGIIEVVLGVDDVSAEQTLRDVADSVGVPLRLAADQVLAAVRAETKADAADATSGEESGGVTRAVLTRSLDAVEPVGRPHGREPLLTRRPRAAR